MRITKPTILIADDDRGLVEALSIRLHAAGYHVVACMDGDDAVETAEGVDPDVIVLDVHMPAGSGPDAQKILQSRGDIDHTPVIYMTGSSPDEVKRISEGVVPFAVVHKPFEADQLISTIQAALEAFPRVL